jgi:hypothetical protein
MEQTQTRAAGASVFSALASVCHYCHKRRDATRRELGNWKRTLMIFFYTACGVCLINHILIKLKKTKYYV